MGCIASTPDKSGSTTNAATSALSSTRRNVSGGINGSSSSNAVNRAKAAAAAEKALSPAAANVLPACDAVRILGEGTFGTVVLVRERSTGVDFAVKVMNKSQLVQEGQLDNIVLERQVLRDAGPHPFVVECHSGFQTPDAVVLVLEYLSGGDMYDLMKAHGTLSEEAAKFYLAETVVGVAELHRHGFVFRDLKLENILIDENGHVRLTDFGLAGKVESNRWDDRSITDISGTAIYQAPEILAGRGHGCVVDWWALGVLAYVLLAGRPPFAGDGGTPALYESIQNTKLHLDDDDRLSHVSHDCKDFIQKLLEKNPALRLGSVGDAEHVRKHAFFKDVDWDALLRFEAKPPFPPPLSRKESAAVTATEEARRAETELHRKLTDRRGKGRFLSGRKSKSSPQLDEGEYKIVHVGNDIAAAEESRISIGLDFRDRNKLAARKTWTGTTDDFGRNVS